MMKMRSCVTALVLACGAAQAQTVQGPSSSATPYLTPVAGGPAVVVYSIITTGDSVNLKPDGVTPYRMCGIPDGLGAYSNGDGTFTLLSNHELTSAMGIPRAHGGVGAFVSQWVVDARKFAPDSPAANPNFLKVYHGQDLDTSVSTTTIGTGGALNVFSRFCSADLAPQTAYFNAATGKGTLERIFLNGEEAGGGGRAIAHVVSEHVGYQLPGWENLNGSWENLLANPAPSDQTLVLANSDGGDNRIFAYIGTKQATGTTIEKAGLVGGSFWGITVKTSSGADLAAENRASCLATSGAPVYSARFTLTAGKSGTTFLRPEDGAWDPKNPRDYYFVTTDRLDTTDGGTGAGANQDGRSRLWRLRFDDLANPTAGGTIQVLPGVEGTGGPSKPNMMDNICVFSGKDGHTRLIMLEDVGNASHNGKVWMYDVNTAALTMILRHDTARFGDNGVPPTAPFTYDKESSGVIDASDILGPGWFFVTVQDHQLIPGELAEGGQLLAFYIPDVARLCAADYNGDGFVDIYDFSQFVACFESGNCPAFAPADFNGDGFTDIYDFSDFVTAFESGC